MTVHDIRTNRPAGRSARRTSSLERRVLVALSHPSDRRSVEHALDGLGLVVRATADSASGLAMVDAFAPDVVVLDAREFHPAVTPLAIAAIERTRTGVVVMGGNSREQRLAALRHGVDDVVSTDTPADEIVGYARDKSAQLIIMATHGYSGVKHVLLGSTTESVLRHAGCPVLSIRSGG